MPGRTGWGFACRVVFAQGGNHFLDMAVGVWRVWLGVREVGPSAWVLVGGVESGGGGGALRRDEVRVAGVSQRVERLRRLA